MGGFDDYLKSRALGSRRHVRDKAPPKVFVPAPGREPWERQPHESSARFAAFTRFRDLGPTRLITELATVTGKQQAVLNTWALEGCWRPRASAWDDHLDKKLREAQVKDVIEMRERHIKLSRTLQSISGMEIAKLARRVQREKDRNVLSSKELIAILDLGIKLERLSRSEPEAIVEQQQKLEVTVDAKREAMQALLGNEKALDALDALHTAVVDAGT